MAKEGKDEVRATSEESTRIPYELEAELIGKMEEMQEKINNLTELINKQNEINAKMTSKVIRKLHVLSKLNAESSELENMKRNTRIDINLPETQKYMKELITRFDELRKEGHSINFASKLIYQEQLVEDSELRKLMRDFLKVRGFGAESEVTRFNMKDYYIERYKIENGVVVKKKKKR